MAPVTGRHSVIDSPDSVRRVMPPITTIATIIAQHTNSHSATGRVERTAGRLGTAMSIGLLMASFRMGDEAQVRLIQHEPAWEISSQPSWTRAPCGHTTTHTKEVARAS